VLPRSANPFCQKQFKRSPEKSGCVWATHSYQRDFVIRRVVVPAGTVRWQWFRNQGPRISQRDTQAPVQPPVFQSEAKVRPLRESSNNNLTSRRSPIGAVPQFMLRLSIDTPTGSQTNIPAIFNILNGLLQLAAFSFRTIKYWSGFAGDLWSVHDLSSVRQQINRRS
jgi:hypothetical protein